ncbi:MAG TPA: hypothetical protein VNX66_06235 [Candidatus Sulfotelmatobacter sp.]|jgi:hypothetical protein|nr:hypothetical protein [Candidatus Sulfotelmatobacter sp.]
MKVANLRDFFAFSISLFVCAAVFDGQKTPKPATQEQESFMLGRILGAVEDVGGGYTKEALGKLSSINKDLEKRRYALRTNWLCHRYYGEALLKDGKREDAIRLLEIAQREANALTETEQKETAELLKRAGAATQ